MARWLMKTEPEAFSIDDLARLGVGHWDGVRSYQARNNLRAMKLGERAFFYHSSVEPKGIVGICEVVVAYAARRSKETQSIPTGTFPAPLSPVP